MPEKFEYLPPATPPPILAREGEKLKAQEPAAASITDSDLAQATPELTDADLAKAQPEKAQAPAPVAPPTDADLKQARRVYTQDDVLRTPLSDLAKDKEFSPVEFAIQNPDASTDPKVLQQLREVYRQHKIQGVTGSDVVEGVKGIPGAIGELGKGVWNRVKNLETIFLQPTVNKAAGLVTGKLPIFQGQKVSPEGQALLDETDKQTTKAIGETAAATESAVQGMANMGRVAGQKLAHNNPLGRALGTNQGQLWENLPPGEVDKQFFSDVENAKQSAAIGQGEGENMRRYGRNASELAKQGIELDPENIQSLTLTDPLTLVAFEGGFQVVNKATGAVLAKAANSALAQEAIQKVQDLAQKGASTAATAAGATVKGVSAVAKVGAKAAPAIGMTIGGLKGGAEGILGGLKSGEIAKEAIQSGAEKVSKFGDTLKGLGESIADGKPLATGARRIVDLGKATGTALADIGKGAAAGTGLAVAGADSPDEAKGLISFGGAFGAIHGAKEGAGKVVEGEFIQPKGEPVPARKFSGYGENPALDKASTDAVSTIPDENARNQVNFIRELAPKLGARVYVYGDEAGGAQMVQQLTGASPDQAAQIAAQQGFTTEVRGADGKAQTLIFLSAKEAAAGHEVFGHALEKVLSPEMNDALDKAARSSFTPEEWEQRGEEYARRFSPQDTRPWREVLSTISHLDADTYLAREARAENANHLFQNRGAEIGKPEDLYRKIVGAVGRTAESAGVPLVSARSKDLEHPISLDIAGKTDNALRGVLEDKPGQLEIQARDRELRKNSRKTAAPAPTPGPTPAPKGPDVRVEEADKAEKIASELNPRDPAKEAILGKVADAIRSGSGVKVDYHNAPGEPAGAPTMSREDRRSIIETFRDMPNDVRPLWEKLHFPDRVEQTKNKGAQLVGWSPENYAANAHRLANWLNQVGRTDLSPYPIDSNTGSFTADGWRNLYKDARTFVDNQQAGGTGSGQPLIVPKGLDVRIPELKQSELSPLDQNTSDFHNILFNVMLPETVRSRKGVMPGNIKGQEIAKANEGLIGPRVTEPGRARSQDEFKEYPGRRIQEVNPLRAEMESEGEKQSKPFPGLIETNQRLNLDHIADVSPAPEAPPIRGVTDTLRGGFLPKEAEDVGKMSPDEFKTWAQGLKGKGFTNVAYEVGAEAKSPEDLQKLQDQYTQFKSEGNGAMKAGDLDKAMALFSQAQFFREAYESATNTGSAKTQLAKGQALPSSESRAMLPGDGAKEENADSASLGGHSQTAQPFVAGGAEDYSGTRFQRNQVAAVWHPSEDTQTTLTDKGQRVDSSVLELSDPQVFSSLVEKAQTANKWGSSVYKYPTEDYAKMRLFATPEGDAGLAVKPDGDMVSVFRAPGKTASPLGSLITLAVQHGAVKADAFNTVLPRLYADYGFKAVARLPWNDEFAPPTWSKAQYEAFQKGEPDVVFLRYEGGDPNTLAERVGTFDFVDPKTLPYAESPEAAAAAQTRPEQLQGAALPKSAPKALTDAMKQATEDFLKDSNNRVFGGGRKEGRRPVDGYDINSGLCEDWAEAVRKNYEKITGKDDVEVLDPGNLSGDPDDSLSGHVFIRLGGKFYDAEAPNGVSDWKKLPLFNADNTNPGGQFKPKKADEFKFKPGTNGGFSRVWITPTGKVEQLGPTWHHDWLSNSTEGKAAQAKYGFTVPKFEGTDSEGVREAALNKGFVRANLNVNNGLLTVEGRAKDWPKQKEQVRQMIESNLDGIDKVRVHLMNDDSTAVQDSAIKNLFDYGTDKEKMDNLPFISDGAEEVRNTGGPAVPVTAEDSGPVFGGYAGEPIFRVFDKSGNLVSTEKSYDKAETLAKANGGSITMSKSFSSAALPKKPTSPETAEEAVKEFGLTHDLNEAGYILPDGRMLDFSEKNNGGGGIRTLDHRAVARLDSLDGENGSAAMVNFLTKTGAARLSYFGAREGGPLSIHTSGVASPGLISELGKLFKDYQITKAYVDLGDPTGRVLNSKDILNPTAGKLRAFYSEPIAGQAAPKKEKLHPEFWIAPNGKVIPAPHGHYDAALDHILPKNWTPENPDDPMGDLYPDVYAKGYVRALSDSDNSIHTIGPTLTRGQRQTVEDLAFEHNSKEVTHNDRPTDIGPSVEGQAAPKKTTMAEDVALPGLDVGRSFNRRAISEMTKEELKRHFPEAVVPRASDEVIDSNITGSPLAKQAGSREAAVKAFSDKLVDFAKQSKSEPWFESGAKWYSEFTPMLKKEFGADAPLFAELLAATSPQTDPHQNFNYAFDTFQKFKRGDYKPMLDKFEDGFTRLEDGRLEAAYKRDVPADERPENISPATLMRWWVDKHDLIARQSNGNKIGLHSDAALQVMARRWLSEARGPKTHNFVQNLLGTGDEATIDLWADRTMRRLGYEGLKDRWRILPENQAGVSDEDFAFSQEAFRHAADRLGMKPSDLQGALWFAEKKHWADNGWGRLDLGDYRTEIKDLDLRRRGWAQQEKLKGKPEPIVIRKRGEKPEKQVEFSLK